MNGAAPASMSTSTVARSPCRPSRLTANSRPPGTRLGQRRRARAHAASARLLLLALAPVLGCAEAEAITRVVPRIEVEQPLSPTDLEASFQPGWERGTRWMVKSRCHPETPPGRRYLTAILGDWPTYQYFEVVDASPEAFLLARTISSLPSGSEAPQEGSRAERFLFRRKPFGLADKLPRESESAELGSVVEKWTLGPCIGSNRHEQRCPPHSCCPRQRTRRFDVAGAPGRAPGIQWNAVPLLGEWRLADQSGMARRRPLLGGFAWLHPRPTQRGRNRFSSAQRHRPASYRASRDAGSAEPTPRRVAALPS